LQRSYGFPGWCAICRWTAVGAISVGTMAVLGAATSDDRPAPTVVRLAAQPEGSGLDWPGWTARDPAEQRRSLDMLLTREKDRRATAKRAAAASIVTRTASAPASPSTLPVPPSALGQGTTLAAPQAVSVAITYALDQVGKPYVWGATGPDSYDCSGLVQRSYATAGIALPRTSREQARVGKAVDLPDLLPGDLLFWAYDPGDLSTVHHVAMYLGDGKIVQAPQPGEFVEVTTMWLSGYAGAVRVATGPATAALPPLPAAVPGTGTTPAGDAMPDGSPPPPVPGTAETPPRTHTRSAASTSSQSGGTSGTTAPDGTPGTSSPGTSSPGTTSPGTTSPGTTSPGGTSPGTTSPGTTSPDSSSPGDSSSPTGSQEPSGSASGTSAPATSSAAPDPTTPPAPAPTSSAASSTPPPAPSTTPPPPPPSTTPPPPAPSPSADASGDSAAPASSTSAAPQPSVSPSSPTPSPG
jgi:cell wall-associated NlpC family hydrolase